MKSHFGFSFSRAGGWSAHGWNDAGLRGLELSLEDGAEETRHVLAEVGARLLREVEEERVGDPLEAGASLHAGSTLQTLRTRGEFKVKVPQWALPCT